jgi:hypothetical protein
MKTLLTTPVSQGWIQVEPQPSSVHVVRQPVILDKTCHQPEHWIYKAVEIFDDILVLE